MKRLKAIFANGMKWLTDRFSRATTLKKILNKDYRIAEDETGQSVEVLTGPFSGMRYRYRWSYLTESAGFATLHFATEILTDPSSIGYTHEFHRTAGDILCSLLDNKELHDSSRTYYSAPLSF